ncbi:MAG: nitrilase-related carbon-nitrogen hydrolase [Pseudomonadota bacterium]
MNLPSAQEPYQALAMQTTCPAVNMMSVSDARDAMLATISRVGQHLAGSIGFLNSFSGGATRLAVLPEYFLTSFPLGESIPEWQAKACVTMDGAEYEALGAIAQKHRIYLSGNLYEIDPSFPSLYFQVSFVIDPSGDVILRYRRLISMYAPTPHDVLDAYLDIYGSDGLFPVAQTDVGRLACVASEEILYPEIARAHVLRGAEVLCHSSSEVGSPQLTPKNIAKRARAYENMIYVVSANSAGITGIPFPAASTDGHSQVVDYKGQILGEASPGESMSGNGEIDIAALRRARRKPGMSNTLARQRVEIAQKAFEDQSVYPANTLAESHVSAMAPERSHFQNAISKVISDLDKRGVI